MAIYLAIIFACLWALCWLYIKVLGPVHCYLHRDHWHVWGAGTIVIICAPGCVLSIVVWAVQGMLQ